MDVKAKKKRLKLLKRKDAAAAKPPEPQKLGEALNPDELMRMQSCINIIGNLMPGMLPNPRAGLGVLAKYCGNMLAALQAGTPEQFMVTPAEFHALVDESFAKRSENAGKPLVSVIDSHVNEAPQPRAEVVAGSPPATVVMEGAPATPPATA
jgi:hypothetical protein